MTRALEDVAAERRRQIEAEGFPLEKDDRYRRGQLVQAALCYGINAVTRAGLLHDGVSPEQIERVNAQAAVPRSWPWGKEWWKPTGHRRVLVKAAALLIAEIERLDRANGPA